MSETINNLNNNAVDSQVSAVALSQNIDSNTIIDTNSTQEKIVNESELTTTSKDTLNNLQVENESIKTDVQTKKGLTPEQLQEQRNKTDERNEQKLLAEYALQTAKGLSGDEFVEYAISHPELYPKRVVDRAISKLTDGKIGSYEDFKYLKELPEEKREQYDETINNPVVKKLKEYVDTNEKEKEFQLYARLSNETNEDIDSFERKYLSDKTFQIVYKSLVDSGRDKESAIRYAVKTINPYAFDKKVNNDLGSTMTTPSSSKVIPANIGVQTEKKESLFTQKYINPLKDW